MSFSQAYFENFYPAYSVPSNLGVDHSSEEATFKVRARRGGLGDDYLIGGIGTKGIRVLDLSEIDVFVTIDFTAPNAGTITDGIDTIVFQDIEEIILAAETPPANLPNPPVGQGPPVRVRLAEQALSELPYLPAE